MSPESNARRTSSWLGWIVAGLLLIAASWMWLERQQITDTIQYHQFSPSKQVSTITDKLDLTDPAKLIFYASHPVVESKSSFNQHCERREASSPILGCYGENRIYIYDVTDNRLDGLKEVTAAHELLHAVYERLSESEKERLQPLLQSAYEHLADDELKTRMEYYNKAEPGETYNELHSIIATEFVEIGDELNDYYKQYFDDRRVIVELHSKVDTQFTRLSEETGKLVEQANALGGDIESKTDRYNRGVVSLNQRVAAFNAKANQAGGFATQAEFTTERAALEAERNQLDALRGQVKANIATYKQLLAQLDAINTKTESLNASIDSVLSDEPEI